MLVEPTKDGPLPPPVALPARDPRIVSMPEPPTNPKGGHKLKRDIKIFSAPSNYDENPPANVVEMCIIFVNLSFMSWFFLPCSSHRSSGEHEFDGVSLFLFPFV